MGLQSKRMGRLESGRFFFHFEDFLTGRKYEESACKIL